MASSWLGKELLKGSRLTHQQDVESLAVVVRCQKLAVLLKRLDRPKATGIIVICWWQRHVCQLLQWPWDKQNDSTRRAL